ncbi:MAG: hypothetical protein IPJ41_03015 [Phycisphaerales bacterium]|nr:hypothetical protein [Phycisphaerales bacterium]
MDHTPKRADATGGSRLAWLIGPAFLGLAAWFVWMAPWPRIPLGATPAFDVGAIVPRPRLAVMTDPPQIDVGSYEHRCDDCHRLFKSSTEKTTGRVQHTEIVFNHGMNNRCSNCHDKEHREKLVLRDGSLISFPGAPLLCAQCHGTTFHDWERGTHGKTLGSWERDNPAFRRLTCVECHDPHSPAFAPIAPLPAPHTLRMGPQQAEVERREASPLAIPFEHHAEPGAAQDEVGTPGGAREGGEG